MGKVTLEYVMRVDCLFWAVCRVVSGSGPWWETITGGPILPSSDALAKA